MRLKSVEFTRGELPDSQTSLVSNHPNHRFCRCSNYDRPSPAARFSMIAHCA